MASVSQNHRKKRIDIVLYGSRYFTTVTTYEKRREIHGVCLQKFLAAWLAEMKECCVVGVATREYRHVGTGVCLGGTLGVQAPTRTLTTAGRRPSLYGSR